MVKCSNILFTPRNGVIIEEIDNISATLPLQLRKPILTEAQVFSVSKFSSGHLCFQCTLIPFQTLQHWESALAALQQRY